MAKLADRLGPGNVIASGAAITAIVYLVIALVQRYWRLLLVYTVSAIGRALIEPAGKAFVPNHGDQSNIAKLWQIRIWYRCDFGAARRRLSSR